MIPATTVCQDHHASKNKRISLSWHGTNPSHSRHRVAIRHNSSGQPPWAWLTITFAHVILWHSRSSSQSWHVHTQARQQRQTASQHRRHRARWG